MRAVEGIVIHRCESGTTGDEVKAAEAKGGLGYHYFIGPTGQLYNLCPDEVLAWHARHWSRTTIGVAVYGDFHLPDGSKHNVPTPEQWVALVTLCKSLVVKFGVLFIMGHTDLAGATNDPKKVCPGANLSVHQIRREVYQPQL